MIAYLEYLGWPGTVGAVIICVLLIINIVGEILELKGKVVPEYIKARKYFSRKRQEKKAITKTLENVERLLDDVNSHYSKDNITKRNDWMCWVNNRAKVYDDSIVEITDKLVSVAKALEDNTKLTEEMFVQNSRDRIIDFANKVADENTIVSREEYNRIFKVLAKYEAFLKERHLTNGEVDVAHQIINDSYKEHMINHTFLEDIRGYNTAK